MKAMLATVAFVTMSISPVLAQSSPQQGEGAGTGVNSQKNSAHKIKQGLERAGFSEIKFLARTFVVEAKSPDGDSVMMTFGPHGQSVFDAISDNNSASSSGSTTGSSSNSSSSAGSQNGSR